MKVIKYLSEQIRELANASDAEFAKNEYWREEDIKRRIYEIIPFWEVPNEDVRKKAEKKYGADISGAKPKEWIIINDKKLHYFDVVGINELLIPNGCFYDTILSAYRKGVFILAEILEHDKLNGLDEFILGEEFVCNEQLGSPAYMYPRRKHIVGRTTSSEYLTWNKIKWLKNNRIDEYGAHFTLKGFELSGLKKREIFAKRPEEIAGKVKEIARKFLKIVIKHEEGHHAGNKHFPYEDFNKALEIAWGNKDFELEGFVSAVSDVIADTVETDGTVGTYPFIFSVFKDDGRGLLYSRLVDVVLPQSPIQHELMKLESDMIIAMPEYEKTRDVGVLREANSEIFLSAKKLAKKICDAESCNELRKIKEDFDKEYENKKDSVKKALEELLEMS